MPRDEKEEKAGAVILIATALMVAHRIGGSVRVYPAAAAAAEASELYDEVQKTCGAVPTAAF